VSVRWQKNKGYRSSLYWVSVTRYVLP